MQPDNSQDDQAAWQPPNKFDDYILQQEIDAGGMGAIYTAIYAPSNEVVAIKFMLKSSQHKRFLREAEAGSKLQHRNFVRFHDTGSVGGHVYIVMDFIDGEPLIKHVKKKNLISEERLTIFHTILEAISYAHEKGIIHRDLKPGNILVDPEGQPVILDFGLSKYMEMNTPTDLSDTCLTLEGQILGTPGYMSPEQARGNVEGQDERSDIFSLGIILYELLTYCNPFQGENFLEICYKIAHHPPIPINNILPGVSPRLISIINMSLAKKKEERYQTAQQFALDVSGYLQSCKHKTINYSADQMYNKSPVPPPPPSPPPSDKVGCFACGYLNHRTFSNCQRCGSPIKKTASSVHSLQEKAAINTPAPSPTPEISRQTSQQQRMPQRMNPVKPNISMTPLDQKKSAPVLITSAQEVKEIAPEKVNTNTWQLKNCLIGALGLPFAVFPIFSHLPVYNYGVEMILGGVAEKFLRDKDGDVGFGVFLFFFIGIFSFILKYQLGWMNNPFSLDGSTTTSLGMLLVVLFGLTLATGIQKFKD